MMIGAGIDPSGRGNKQEAIAKLARSGDAQQLMKLLRKENNMQGAAQAAAAGNPSELLSMLRRLMSTPEGTKLIENISQKARENGLTEE